MNLFRLPWPIAITAKAWYAVAVQKPYLWIALVMQAVLVVLKLTSNVGKSWWVVFIPSMMFVAFFLVTLAFAWNTHRKRCSV